MKVLSPSNCKRAFFALFLLLSTFVIKAQTAGDYRSVINGFTLNWNSVASWERYNGSAWQTPTMGQGYPGQYAGTGAVLIQNSQTAIVYLNVSPANAIGSLQVGTAGGSYTAKLQNSAGSYNLKISGDLKVNNGKFSIESVSGTRAYTLSVNGNIYVEAGSTLDFIAAGDETANIILGGTNQVINGPGTIESNTWTLSNTGTVSINSDINAGNLVVNSNSILNTAPTVRINPSAATGTISGSGTVRCTRITSSPSFTAQYRFSNFNISNVAVEMTGAGAQNIEALSMRSLILGGNGIKTCTAGFSVSNGLTIGAGTALSVGPYGHTVGRTLTVNGTLDFNHTNGYFQTINSSNTTITMASSGLIKTLDQSGLGPVANASLRTNGTTWSIGNSGTVGTIEYYNNAAQTVSDRNYNHLLITNMGIKTWALAANRTVTGNITLNGDFTTSGTGTLSLKGNWIRNSGSYASGNITLNMAGASAQTIYGNGSAFYNLTINQSPASTVTNAGTSGAFSVANTLRVTRGNLVLGASNADYNFFDVVVSANGIITHNVGWDATSKKVSIAGKLDITGRWNPLVRSHVSMTGTGTKTLRTGTNAASKLSILTLAGTGTYSMNGNLVCDQEVWACFGSTGTFTTNAYKFSCTSLLNNLGTVNFSNGSTVTISGDMHAGYGTNTGRINVANTAKLTVQNLVINTNASLICSGSPTINVGGSWTRNGAFTPATGTINFNGASPSNLGGTVAAQSFYILTLAKGYEPVNLAGSLTSLTVTNKLNLNSGYINAGNVPVILTANTPASLTNGGGYVFGKLQRAVTNTSGYVFPVGSSAGYGSVTFNFTSLTGTGSIAVQTNAVGSGLYPATLHASKRLAFSWSVSKTGITAFNSNAVFSYSSTSLLNGATDATLKIYTANPSINYTTITPASNKFNINGLNFTGEIGAGECLGTLAASLTKTKASSCNNGNDGSITLTTNGGVSPYSFAWTGPAGFTSTASAITGLGVGDYTVIIKDITGCSFTYPDISIQRAPAPALTNNISLASLCVADGAVTLYATLGVPPYTYSIDGVNYQTSNVFTNLAGGDYTGYVKDSKGCVSTRTINLPTVAPLNFVTSTVTASACLSNGKLVLSPSGGRAPYTYSKDGITYQSSNTFSNMAAGAYTGYVKDSKGCVFSKPVSVPGAAPVVATGYAAQSGACSNDGTIRIDAAGGRAPYTYSIDNVHYVSANIFTGLTGNQNYTGWVKDADGCKSSIAIFVPRQVFTASVLSTNTSTCTNTGTLRVSVTGGIPGFTYSLNNISFQANPVFQNLPAGNYTVWVKDSRGCLSNTTATIGTLDPVTVSAVATPASVCANSGMIRVYPTGGQSPFTYSLDNINYQNSVVFSNLAPGTYTAWAKSATGCKSSVSVTVGIAPNITASARFTNSSNCVPDGSIQVVPNTGVSPFSFSIDGTHFQSSNSFTGLAAANYNIVVKDGTGCTGNLQVTIGTNVFTATSIDGPASSCAASNGFIKLLPSGGNNPYQYSMDGISFQNSPMFNGLQPGSYTGYIKDAKGCVAQVDAEVGPINCNMPNMLSRVNNADGKDVKFGSVYPNPSSNYFNIDLGPLKESVVITVFDIEGKQIEQKRVTSKSKIEIGSTWKAGIYIVQIIQDGERRTLRLVKQ